jgi:hypothetical protein
MDKAIAFKQAHPEEKVTTAARIYKVNDHTIWTNLQRARQRRDIIVKHSSYNKVLSNVQVEAIYKYVEDSYLSSYRATKAMVYAVIGCLRANQIPLKDPPT